MQPGIFQYLLQTDDFVKIGIWNQIGGHIAVMTVLQKYIPA